MSSKLRVLSNLLVDFMIFLDDYSKALSVEENKAYSKIIRDLSEFLILFVDEILANE